MDISFQEFHLFLIKMVKLSKLKLNLTLWVTLFVGITFAFFMWLSWQKLTEWIGNSNIVWGITGLIVLIAIPLGYFSFNKIVNKFIN